MVKDPLGHPTTSTYDALNRLTQVTNPLHEITNLGYEQSGGLTQVTDPRSLITTYTLDGFGQPTGVASPDTGGTTSTYDPAGNLLTQTDARGVTATYTYDDINRVKSVTYSKSGAADEIHLFEYDSGANAKGRLTRVSDPAAVTAWTYEAHGRVLSKSQTVGTVTGIVSYGYNTSGQLQTLTTPSGQQIGYTYLNNRVSGITVNGSPVIVSATTEPFGPLSVWHWANNHYSYRDFDLDGRVATWEFRNGVSVIRNDLTFDNASRVTQISDPANASLLNVYQYDDGDKVNQVQRGNPVASTVQYAYDSVGNRNTTTLDAGSITAVYGTTNNRLQSMSGALPAGYMLAASNVVFTYNNANRLVGIQADGATVASYLVNALGQRVQKSAGGATTVFVYDEAGHLLGEYDGTGALIQETVWMEDLPVATLRPSAGGGVSVYYVHPDHLGTPRAITRPSDNVFMWRWDNIEAFGNSQANESPAGQGTFKYALRFPGQYYDAEIGTNYNYFRHYDPVVGRYVEGDPIGLEGGISTFAYADGSPLMYSDNDGQFANFAIGALAGVASGYAIAWLTGDTCYGWKDALEDAALGAVGAGLVSKLNKLYRVSKLRKIAGARGMENLGRFGYTETWKNPVNSLERLNIKFEGGKSPNLAGGSKVPRFDFRIDAGKFWDPFTGQVGPKGALSHVPLEPVSPKAAMAAGAAAGVVGQPECECHK